MGEPANGLWCRAGMLRLSEERCWSREGAIEIGWVEEDPEACTTTEAIASRGQTF